MTNLKSVAENNDVEIELEVIPNSKQFAILGFNPWTNALRIKVKEKALKGQANKGLVKELEKRLGCGVEIKSGEKSRRKKLPLKGAEKSLVLKFLKREKLPKN